MTDLKLGILLFSQAATWQEQLEAAKRIDRLGYTHLPLSMMLGLGIGFFHGLVVSLALVWIVSERHPLEEFNDAGLAVGLSHLLGHVVYGGVVGVVVGLSSL